MGLVSARTETPDLPPADEPTGGGAHPALRFVARRVAVGILTLLVVSVLVFAATNALPGNVAQVVLGRNATPAHVAALDHTLGLDKPLLTRYLSWIGDAVRGNLGKSAVQAAQGTDAPVTGLLAAPVRNSLVLAVTTAIVLLPLSLAVGTFAALRAGRPDAYALSYLTLVLNALPEFVFGTILIFIFFSGLDLFPPGRSRVAGHNTVRRHQRSRAAGDDPRGCYDGVLRAADPGRDA
jgi:peptide/nickel transport system permease protein